MSVSTVGGDVRVTRWVATIAGLIGFVLSVATPLLPVVQTTATLNWPQGGQLNSVTAPLISLTPVDLTATVPCSLVRDLPPGGGVILSTGPKKGKDAALNALFVVAHGKRVDVTDRNVVIASASRDQVAGAGCSRIEIASTRAGTFATFVGLTDPAGKPLGGGFPDPNLRPQIVGVFTDLTGPAPAGLKLSATIDTRFSTTPTTLKLAAMVTAILATIVALVALWRLDQLDGHRMRRLIPANWRTFTLADVAVIFGFVLWHVIGANSSDDGYILGMARVADRAGYMSNYFRWFGSPEDPFGWYYNLLALMTHVSDASLWMRLPDLFAGIVCWLLLSREVLPRLGPAVAASRPANWAAGMVLLTAWMPFDNGLRPEPIIALGSLVTYVLIERSMRYSRLTPAALAVITAAFTLGVQPTGLIAVAALVAGGRPILRILVRRHRVVGTWPLVAPMLAAGTVILTVVFADQTLATVLEATRIRTAIGPSQAWYTENLRYYYLILPTVDGSLSRRFGFLITALCLFTAVFIMLRRKRIPGVARGPAWRLMGVIFGTMFFLMFTPTKWVHHFGLFAAVGAAMAALTTVLVSPAVLRWSRNRMAFLAALLFMMALCFATTNGWWYVSSYGVPFNSTMPKIGGITVSTVFFAMFVAAALYAIWLHFASREHGEGRLARALTAAPVPLAAGFMALVFIASMVAGIVRQYPTYSNAWDNLREFSGGCGLADDVLVEPDSNVGYMTPLGGDYGPLGPLGGQHPVGFSPNGVPEHTVAEAIRITPDQPGTDYDWDAPTKLSAPGINGSTVPLPYGLDAARVPLAGSYTTGAQQQSRLTSAWYRLPAPDDGHPLVVVTAAGKIAGNSVLHHHTDGQTVVLEYGRPGPGGDIVPAGRLVPYDLYGEQPKAWRNLRFARSDMPADTVAVRVVAEDLSLTPEDWIAVTPPRVPEMRSLQEYVGSTQPVLMDWAVGLAFPCQQPMLHVNGVTEIPKFRITPDYTAKKMDTDTWEDGTNGGLLGITDLLLRAHVMSTYLSHDWGRDWGSLRRFETIADAHPAQLDLGTATRTGWWSPGPIRIKP
ncbi:MULTISPECIES: arabinosyltransferase EmbB [Mycobacterium avium complex (MAC)]|uniref:Arabinosyltransferase n=2 Tax=Mycobacterium avium complex (MAC) TaxID=120793 RepID=A0ABX3TQW8_9MYCO|nr:MULTISPECIES: arabinosyltransferase EmbB [Mycobacterium avium complex (MAC)]MBZ4520758.1 arabinosyltransferase [Mycobacterium avium subsp. hominissuis]MBZ4528407.1 arabinosyltransferase [Mycobacterium avium subsp. hominissuis]MBZ4548856.1 arabinosyltransferase [Mycobacterium avium subsp. hominissuis]MBZ4583136.1 arabinosyltransferase [Mycobacterium avium subsp. hominissuis]MBZ4595451.1 arabinosyltransferase [Mycobacterium avium subsp. hominissuis]